MRVSPRDRALLLLALAALALSQDAALAQAARHPFAVGPSEAPVGAASGLAGLLLAWQSKFHMELQNAARALKTDNGAFFTLAAASFAYGVFHAAGPGHGKAVLTSYMIANETALKRGLTLAALAALLQGVVAIALVGVAAIVFGVTAQRMTEAATWIETASYAAIAAVGARLAYVKGRALLAALREPAPVLAVARRGAFACEAIDDDIRDDPAHIHGPGCGHMHAIDAARLGAGFRWGDALATVVAAGLRPCSGAILVLVFTLSQGVFIAGAGATLLMSAGTAITTGALAATAVFAKDFAARLAARRSSRAEALLRAGELLAALLVLAFGLALLLGMRAGAVGA
ncbi:high frequency lysogenization protein HflD [Methylosinus sp. R-45379]|uniref:nickel/cobalt transporter n=1 Tax=Methylosinus sp. R-45379 TaxID=980563 RepID=UPI0007D82CB6|nr:nickel/cobalt transporter [Methylosinus sp. R-45379]OAI30162.1 high frequency lysogenization protein HflD [Methylosinus sp. R-45379]